MKDNGTSAGIEKKLVSRAMTPEELYSCTTGELVLTRDMKVDERQQELPLDTDEPDAETEDAETEDAGVDAE